jgi:putative ABC transport system permease protein
MTRFLPLLFANLRRKRARTTLTIASIVVAFLLFGVLEAVRAALSGGVQIAGQSRLITINKISLVQRLPVNRLYRIRAIEGVTAAGGQSWFGGIYQNEKNQITSMAVTHDNFLDVYPEIVLGEKEKHDWLNERTGAIVGRPLAYRFGWKVGDVIPLRSTIWVKNDGSSIWYFKIVGIFDYSVQGRDSSRLFFHWDYLNESLTEPKKDLVGWVVFNIADPNRAVQIASNIDGEFENSAAETKTTTEQAFAKDYANQIGDVGAIVLIVAFAVFFTMLLVAANTMSEAVRERTNELAVMKAIGFADRSVMLLVLLESLLITVIGGTVGLGLAALLSAMMGPALEQLMPFVGVPISAYVRGIVLMAVMGVLAGTLPCIQARQLEITDALRRV